MGRLIDADDLIKNINEMCAGLTSELISKEKVLDVINSFGGSDAQEDYSRGNDDAVSNIYHAIRGIVPEYPPRRYKIVMNALMKQERRNMKYRKKPVEIEAFQYDGKPIRANGNHYIPDWAVKAFENKIMYYTPLNDDSCELFINTLEGIFRVSVGDFVIQGVNGEIYPCKPDIFEKTYERVTETIQ